MTTTSTKLGKGNFTPVPMTDSDGKVIYSGRGRFPASFHQKIVDTNTIPALVDGAWTWIDVKADNAKHVKILNSAKALLEARTNKTSKTTKVTKVMAEATEAATAAAAAAE